jgi:hypothetical protein
MTQVQAPGSGNQHDLHAFSFHLGFNIIQNSGCIIPAPVVRMGANRSDRSYLDISSLNRYGSRVIIDV